MGTQRQRNIKILKLLSISLIVILSILITKLNPVVSQDTQTNETVESLETESSPEDSTLETIELKTEDINSESTESDEEQILDEGETKEASPLDKIWSNIWVQILSTLSLFFTLSLTFINQWLRNRIDELKNIASKRLDEIIGFKSPARLEPNTKINSVMVLGLGGSGKTSLCQQLTTDSEADNEIPTAQFKIYSRAIDTPADNSKLRCKIYVSDYPGQSFLEELIAGFIEEQFLPYSPMRYGYINSLILVVDLFPPPDLPNEPIPKASSLNKDRIQENCKQWNEQALSAVFGIINSTSLKYICLFINKIDCLEPRMSDEDVKKEYLDLYKLLVKKASTGRFMRILVGSAFNGESVGIILKDLVKYSVNPENANKIT